MKIPNQPKMMKHKLTKNDINNRTSNRNRNKTEILIYPTMQLCQNKIKKFEFKDEDLCQLETCQNMITY